MAPTRIVAMSAPSGSPLSAKTTPIEIDANAAAPPATPSLPSIRLKAFAVPTIQITVTNQLRRPANWPNHMSPKPIPRIRTPPGEDDRGDHDLRHELRHRSEMTRVVDEAEKEDQRAAQHHRLDLRPATQVREGDRSPDHERRHGRKGDGDPADVGRGIPVNPSLVVRVIDEVAADRPAANQVGPGEGEHQRCEERSGKKERQIGGCQGLRPCVQIIRTALLQRILAPVCVTRGKEIDFA